MSSNNRIIGVLYEAYALQYLLGKNMTYLAGNYVNNSYEVDLIMQEEDEIVFVEVKMRNASSGFDVNDSVNKFKLLKVLKAGLAFIRNYNLSYKRYRVDVIFITLGLNKFEVEHYSDLVSD